MTAERKVFGMREEKLKAQAEEIVRQAVRQEGIVQTAEVMDCVPDLVGAVEFDLVQLQNIVIAELN